MQILIALNLLTALAAIHLPELVAGAGTSDVASASRLDLIWQQGTCLFLAMVMTIIFSEVITRLTTITFQSQFSGGIATSSALRQRKAASSDVQRLIAWTVFSLFVTFYFRWSLHAQLLAGNWPIVPQLLILAPHLTCLLVIWTVGDWNEQRHRTGWGDSVFRSIRGLGPKIQLLLVPIVLPILAVYLVRDGLDAWSGWKSMSETHQTLLLSLLAMGLLFLIYPFLLTRLWNLRALSETAPAQANELMQLAKQLRLRIANVQIWQTRFRIANAAVIGWIPGVRRVLLSDVLVKILSPAELECVFLHEAGHIRHSHSMWRTTIVMIPLLLFVLVFRWTQKLQLAYYQVGMILLTLVAFTGSAWLLGWISRQLELEADRFAWRHWQLRRAVHDDSQQRDPLAAALIKTAQVTGASLHHGSLLHPTTAQRISQLGELYRTPEAGRERDRNLRKGKMAILSLLLTLTGLVAATLSFSS